MASARTKRGTTWSVWSWSAPRSGLSGGWLEVMEGASHADAQESLERKYRASRNLKVSGSAYILREAGNPPNGYPEDLGVEVVEAEEEVVTSPAPAAASQATVDSPAKTTRLLAEQIEKQSHELAVLAEQTWRQAATLGDEDAKLYVARVYDSQESA